MSHPDPSVLAEYRAGLVSGRRGAKIAAHLAECERCAALGGQLAEVSVLLASAPRPAMPDSVARRLDTVLAAEAAKRQHDSERAGARAPRHRARDPRRSGRDRFRFVTLRVLAPVAAVVAVAAVGYSLTHLSGPTNSSAASAAAAPAASASSSASASVVPSSAASSAAKGAAGAYNAGSNANPRYEPSPRFTVISSRTDYLRSTLVQQLEAARQALATTGPGQQPTTQIDGCVSRVTRGTSPGVPELVERARFQGQPAIVIIASSGHGSMAWITSPSCSATSSDVVAQTALP
jgi:hypothetical protein